MTTTVPRSAAFVTVALLGALGACESHPLVPPPGDEIIIDFDGGLHPWPRDDRELHDARLEDAELEITVAYAGGCKTHEFWLVAVDDWQILPDAGPTPRVGAPALLAHDAHGDPCEAWITQTLPYDLEPLRTAYRQDFDDFGPASILVRIPGGQGAADTLTLDLFVPTAYPPD